MAQARPLLYTMTLTAGPGEGTADIDVVVWGAGLEEIHRRRETWFSFGLTWRHIAEFVRQVWREAGGDEDPVSTVSPHIDLT